MPAVAQKAKEATVLIQQLHATQDPLKRETIVTLLNGLWPSIRCRFDEMGQLRVWYLGDRVKRLPRALNFAAHYVEAVQPDGSAYIVKDTMTPRQGNRLDYATILLSEFEPKVGRTVWELIADPVDWL